MRRLTVLLASTAIAFGLAAGARGQTGPGTKAPTAGDRFRTQFFERLDADKDGKVTKAEFDAARAKQFKDADKNGDGFVSKDEFAAYGAERRGESIDRQFARLDKNGDGKITADELTADRRGNRGTHRFNFDRADAAKKGFLTLEDFTKVQSTRFEAALKKRFDALDTNRDGKLTADELPADNRALRADANKDGAVTFEEFAARPRGFLARRVEAEFKAMDADGDGKLTKGEYQAAADKPWLILRADANKDGAVTKDELAKAFTAQGSTPRDRVFGALDADMDGKISAAEWQAAGDRQFARLDRDKDGVITADEVNRRPGRDHNR